MGAFNTQRKIKEAGVAQFLQAGKLSEELTLIYRKLARSSGGLAALDAGEGVRL